MLRISLAIAAAAMGLATNANAYLSFNGVDLKGAQLNGVTLSDADFNCISQATVVILASGETINLCESR